VLAIFPATQRGVWKAGLDPAQSPFAVSLWLVWTFPFPWRQLPTSTLIAFCRLLPHPFLAWNVAQESPRSDRFLGNLAYPLYLFHWIPREWYYHLSLRSDPAWRQCALLAVNLLAAAAGAIIILLLVDQPSERLREGWVSSRKVSLEKRGCAAQG
jgi:peptidoglycan/LPS O-acetylase OafA/YrhL